MFSYLSWEQVINSLGENPKWTKETWQTLWVLTNTCYPPSNMSSRSSEPAILAFSGRMSPFLGKDIWMLVLWIPSQLREGKLIKFSNFSSGAEGFPVGQISNKTIGWKEKNHSGESVRLPVHLVWARRHVRCLTALRLLESFVTVE